MKPKWSETLENEKVSSSFQKNVLLLLLQFSNGINSFRKFHRGYRINSYYINLSILVSILGLKLRIFQS
jgi:hypothetical protein